MPGRPPRDRSGDRYGMLTAVKQVGVNQHAQALWECKCDCGAIAVKSVVALNNGARQCTRSCPLGVHVRHGAAVRGRKSKEYRTWQDMIRRCYDNRMPNYHRYGGRGVSVCDEWRESFTTFYDHIGPAPDGHRISIDRIDNSGNYEPGNVRWATPAEQSANRG